MPRWVHTIFLDIIPRWLFMRRPAPCGRRRQRLLLLKSRRSRLLRAPTGSCLSTSANWFREAAENEEAHTRCFYEDLELGTLSSNFSLSFRPPSPRPPGSTPTPSPPLPPPSSLPLKHGPPMRHDAVLSARHPGGRVNHTMRQSDHERFSLSPSIMQALEGVHYIADHLRAQDADFSVSEKSQVVNNQLVSLLKLMIVKYWNDAYVSQLFSLFIQNENIESNFKRPTL